VLTKLRAEFDILQRIELEIRVTEKRLEELRTARRLILELRSMPVPDFSLFETESPAQGMPARSPQLVLRSLGEPSLSIHEAAEIVMRRNGAPLSVQEIAEQMMSSGYIYPDGLEKLKGVVRATLWRKIQDGDTFAKEGRGLFGLAEWETAREWRVPERVLPDQEEEEKASVEGVGAPPTDASTLEEEGND
jgi:hypothetical protein